MTSDASTDQWVLATLCEQWRTPKVTSLVRSHLELCAQPPGLCDGIRKRDMQCMLVPGPVLGLCQRTIRHDHADRLKRCQNLRETYTTDDSAAEPAPHSAHDVHLRTCCRRPTSSMSLPLKNSAARVAGPVRAARLL